jgi:hypothetical protein
VTRLGDAPPADLLDPAERMSVDELRGPELRDPVGELQRIKDRRG